MSNYICNKTSKIFSVPVGGRNLHGIGRDVLPFPIPHHRDPVLVARKLDELPQLLLKQKTALKNSLMGKTREWERAPMPVFFIFY
jgi:hypothetical protein